MPNLGWYGFTLRRTGKPANTQTSYDFAVKYDGEKSNLGVVVHEMRHQFDQDIGNMQDNTYISDPDNPSEIRAVFNSNLARKLVGKVPETTYGGRKIDPKKLVNPPNNKQCKDENK